jgi:hypothetical protein
MNPHTTTPDARRRAHLRVGGAATAAFLALLLAGALHQSAEADTSTPAVTPSPQVQQQQQQQQPQQPRQQQVQPPSPQGEPSAPGDGRGFWHHRGGGSAPSAPGTGGDLDGSTT